MIPCDAMKIMTDKELIAAVEAFLKRTQMKPTRFGREVMGDGALVQHLKEGRSLSLKNAGKVVRFMNSYRPPAEQDKAA